MPVAETKPDYINATSPEPIQWSVSEPGTSAAISISIDEDLMDVATIENRRKNPTRPLDDFLKDCGLDA